MNTFEMIPAKLYLRELYVSSLKELARVTRKWGVFLCADKRSMKHAIETLCGDGLKLWRFIHCRMINHGGSRVGIYLFKKYDFFLRELNVKNKENTGWMIDLMIEAIYLQNCEQLSLGTILCNISSFRLVDLN